MKVGSGVRFDADGFPVAGGDDPVIEAAKKTSEARRVSPCIPQSSPLEDSPMVRCRIAAPFCSDLNVLKEVVALHGSFRRYLYVFISRLAKICASQRSDLVFTKRDSSSRNKALCQHYCDAAKQTRAGVTPVLHPHRCLFL